MACSSWFGIFTSTRKLHADAKFVIRGNKNAEKLLKKTKNKLEFQQRVNITNLLFCDTNIAFKKDFWKTFGKNIKYLGFVHCKFTTKPFYKLLRQCPNLEILEIYGPGLKQETIEKISTLTFKNMKHFIIPGITDYSLKTFLQNYGNIKMLNLDDYHYVRDADKYYENMKDCKQLSQLPAYASKKFLSLTYLRILLPITNITSLILTDTETNNDDILAICKLKQRGLRLEKLDLANCLNFNEGIKEIAYAFAETLTLLNIGGCWFISYPDLFFISHLINLKTLNMTSILNVNDLVIKSLKELKKLECLLLYQVNNILPDTIENTFSFMKNLKSLYLHGINVFSMDSVLNLLRNNKGLCALYLDIKDSSYMGKLIEVLCMNHPTLKNLSLYFCNEDEKVKLSYMCNKCPCDIPITSYHKFEHEHGIRSLTNLRRIEFVGIGCCFENISQLKSNELKELTFDLTNIDDTQIKYISENCPALINLSINFCKKITDDGIFYASDLKRLRKLSIQENQRITVVGLKYLLDSSCPLTSIKINYENGTYGNNEEQIIMQLEKKMGGNVIKQCLFSFHLVP